MEKKEIGRHVLAGLPGLTVDDHTRQLIQEWHIAGVVLFARNFKDAAQFQALTTELQLIAQAAGYTQPLLIALDQENGVIRRINRDASLFPGAMTIAATGEPANAYRMYRASALELRALGVNWNLAPDADVNTNPANPVIGVRSFGADPHRVAAYVQQAVRGIQSAGVLATLKHFPGHGDTSVDSHLGLPVVDKSLAELLATELVPFRAASKKSASIMLAHILLPQLGNDRLPASLSPIVIQDVLRRQLGYRGVIVTDDLEMQGVQSVMAPPAAAYQALHAGADLVMISHTAALQTATLEYLAAHQAELSLDASADRIATMIQTIGEPPAISLTTLRQRHGEAIHDVYRQAVTVGQEAAPAVVSTLRTAQHIVLVTNQITESKVVDFTQRPNLRGTFRAVFPKVDEYQLVPGDTEKILAAANAADAVFLLTQNIQNSNNDMVRWAKQLPAAACRKTIGISVRNPYDQVHMPRLAGYYALYEPAPIEIAVLLSHWFTGQPLPGQLPVTLAP